jgi:hypothetical protein
MELRMLGRSGLKMSPLCFGGNVFGWAINETKHFSVRDRLRINICIFLSSGPPVEAFRHCSFAHCMKGAFGAKGVKCPTAALM